MTDVIPQEFDPAVPIATIVEHPDNPRRGDEAAIERSLDAHGFYGSVLVQKSSRRIIAGNHRHRTLKAKGAATIPVLFADVDDDEALRILLNDNRTNDSASYHDDVLADVLQRMEASAAGLVGTGYDGADLAALLSKIDPEPLDLDAVLPLDEGSEHHCPYCGARWQAAAGGVRRLDK